MTVYEELLRKSVLHIQAAGLLRKEADRHEEVARELKKQATAAVSAEGENCCGALQAR